MTDGWDDSAKAWIRAVGDVGDFGRRFVLDGPMLARVEASGFGRVLDVGCGEGRFCRMMRAQGLEVCGIDPTAALLQEARRRDPQGDYRLGRAEALPFSDSTFDLVVSYLSLIDVAGLEDAITEMARVLRPGGALLIANLTSFATAGAPDGWTPDGRGQLRFTIDRYLEEHADGVSWSGIRIRNWHRPLSTYMRLLIDQSLVLTHFAEPAPTGGDPKKADRSRRVPLFHIMEWRKPG